MYVCMFTALDQLRANRQISAYANSSSYKVATKLEIKTQRYIAKQKSCVLKNIPYYLETIAQNHIIWPYNTYLTESCAVAVARKENKIPAPQRNQMLACHLAVLFHKMAGPGSCLKASLARSMKTMLVIDI